MNNVKSVNVDSMVFNNCTVTLNVHPIQNVAIGSDAKPRIKFTMVEVCQIYEKLCSRCTVASKKHEKNVTEYALNITESKIKVLTEQTIALSLLSLKIREHKIAILKLKEDFSIILKNQDAAIKMRLSKNTCTSISVHLKKLEEYVIEHALLIAEILTPPKTIEEELIELQAEESSDDDEFLNAELEAVGREIAAKQLLASEVTVAVEPVVVVKEEIETAPKEIESTASYYYWPAPETTQWLQNQSYDYLVAPVVRQFSSLFFQSTEENQ